LAVPVVVITCAVHDTQTYLCANFDTLDI
jgi:hypothetical protein